VSRDRALVTGAGGFVAANLVRRLLADGSEVHAVVRPGGSMWRLTEVTADLQVVEQDLEDTEGVHKLVQTVAPDVIFNLAAYGAYSWQQQLGRMVAVNVLATAALLEAATAVGVRRLVQAGSSSEYGAKDHAPAEDELLEPNSRYAMTKAGGTHLCAIGATDSPSVAVLRLYSVYGPWEEPGRLLPTLMVRGRRGELPPLVNPDTPRDLVHVYDVCDAFVRAARTELPADCRIYNIGSGRQTTIGEIVALVCDRLSIAAAPQWGGHAARSWDTRVWASDAKRAANELGWEATTSLPGGIEQMAMWFSSPDVPSVY
jgi:nucleoside-diphosphate-sugar epimerase